MSYYVYLLVSSTSKHIISYVGYTKDLKKRIKEHNSSKGAKFTKGKKWKLAYFEEYTTKNKAMKEEYLLKKNTKKRNIIKNNFLNKNENIHFTSI